MESETVVAGYLCGLFGVEWLSEAASALFVHEVPSFVYPSLFEQASSPVEHLAIHFSNSRVLRAEDNDSNAPNQTLQKETPRINFLVSGFILFYFFWFFPLKLKDTWIVFSLDSYKFSRNQLAN